MLTTQLGKGVSLLVATAALLIIHSPTALAGSCEDGTFSSTFEVIEKVIFARHNCSDDLCHGSTAQGGLDLRDGSAYANLVEVDAQTVPGFKRVATGQKDDSLLWLNLAAKTFPKQWKAPLRAMPADPAAALTAEELEVVRLWIEAGAPKTGVVQGSVELVDACLPPPEPIAIDPLPPPAPGTGVQIHMPRWTLEPHSEHEVCYASYYDVTDQVPEELRQANGTFRYKSYESRQDPLSHHLIVNLYEGRASISRPGMGHLPLSWWRARWRHLRSARSRWVWRGQRLRQ